MINLNNVKNYFQLDDLETKKIEVCVKRYAEPDPLVYLFHRIWNAVKSIFGKSDWQVARQVLASKNVPNSNLKILEVFQEAHKQKKVFSEFLLETLVLQYSQFEFNLQTGKLWDGLEMKTEMVECLDDYVLMAPRFKDIICPAATHVKNPMEGGDHLHANCVKHPDVTKAFIASQAPQIAEEELFWQTVHKEGYHLVDLTNGNDRGFFDFMALTGHDVTVYFPTQVHSKKVVGCMSIELIEEAAAENGHEHTYKVVNGATGEEKTVRRYYPNIWPDHGVVPLGALTKLVEAIDQKMGDKVWVHCRAGVGRTGTVITALILRELISAGKLERKKLDENLVQIILELRKQRGPCFVQTKEQLGLLRTYGQLLCK